MTAKRPPGLYRQVNVPGDVPLVPDGRGGLRAATPAEVAEFRARNGMTARSAAETPTGDQDGLGIEPTDIAPAEPAVVTAPQMARVAAPQPSSSRVYSWLELFAPKTWRALGSPPVPRIPVSTDVGHARDTWDPFK